MICKVCGNDAKKWFRISWRRNSEDEYTEEVLCEPCVDHMLEEVNSLDDFVVTERWDDCNKRGE